MVNKLFMDIIFVLVFIVIKIIDDRNLVNY